MTTRFIQMVPFIPRFEVAGAIEGIRDEQTIKREPQLFSCDIDSARRLGGTLTREALDAIDHIPSPTNGRALVVDTRVHMLKRGFYPAIPGWHCDACDRGGGDDAQPVMPPSTACAGQRHWTVIVATRPNLSRTEFVVAQTEIPVYEDAVWASVDEWIASAIGDEQSMMRSLVEGHILMFNSMTLHRARPATTSGWRFFFRLSEMLTVPRNEVRTQTQVYCDVRAGW